MNQPNKRSKRMTPRQLLDALLALPDPDLMLPSPLTAPQGRNTGYYAATVVKLLATERERCARACEQRAESSTVHDGDLAVWLEAAQVIRDLNDQGKRTPEARSAVGGPLDPPVVPPVNEGTNTNL